MRSIRSLKATSVATALLCATLMAAGAIAKPPAKRPTVAVLYFDYAGKDAELGALKKGLAQMLITSISEVEAVQVVERTRLESVLNELKLSRSKKMDKRTVAKVGKLLGAQHLVLGSYFSVMGTLRIDTRVVNVQTGAVELSVGANGKNEEFLSIHQNISDRLKSHVVKALRPIARVESRSGLAKHAQKATSKRRPKPSRPRVKQPKRLHLKTAIQYAKALDAKDRKDFKAAKAHLNKALKQQPDFALARQDLAMMM